MSWLSGYKSKLSTSESEADSREAKRNKLEADRLQRTQQREATKRQLLAAQESREQANQALQEYFNRYLRRRRYFTKRAEYFGFK